MNQYGRKDDCQKCDEPNTRATEDDEKNTRGFRDDIYFWKHKYKSVRAVLIVLILH